MTRFNRIAALALLAAPFALPAAAQDYPRIVGSGENATVEYGPNGGNVVGGATYRVIGAGEGAVIEELQVQHAQTPALARVTGSGENQSVIYEERATAVAPNAASPRG
jgi:hypothetical protein